MDYSRIKKYAKKVKQGVNYDLDTHLIAKVTGVTFEGRQKVLKQMSKDTPVKLERDRRNEYDSYAVKVLAELKGKWVQTGFIPRPMSRRVAESLDNGVCLPAHVHRVIGGMFSEHSGEVLNFGLEICINPER